MSKPEMLTRLDVGRTPRYSFAQLTEWYQSGEPSKMARVLSYWRNRVEMDIEMLEAAEIIDQNW